MCTTIMGVLVWLGNVPIHRKVACCCRDSYHQSIQLWCGFYLTPQPRPMCMNKQVGVLQAIACNPHLAAQTAGRFAKTCPRDIRVCEAKSQIKHIILIIVCLWNLVIMLLILDGVDCRINTTPVESTICGTLYSTHLNNHMTR